MDKITIRSATEDDLETLVTLNNQIFVNNPQYDDDIVLDFSLTPEGRKYFKEAIEKSDCFLIAEEDRKMIGYVNGKRKGISHRKSRYFEIVNLGVLPEKKKRGIGKLLLQSITNWAKEHNYQKIYLDCYAKNIEALDFYQKNNFKQINIILEKVI